MKKLFVTLVLAAISVVYTYPMEDKKMDKKEAEQSSALKSIVERVSNYELKALNEGNLCSLVFFVNAAVLACGFYGMAYGTSTGEKLVSLCMSLFSARVISYMLYKQCVRIPYYFR
jgi:hypothetical protein